MYSLGKFTNNKSVIFFLLSPRPHVNVCCGYSLEAPWQSTSNEYQQHMLLLRNKKNISTFWLKKKNNNNTFCSYVWFNHLSQDTSQNDRTNTEGLQPKLLHSSFFSSTYIMHLLIQKPSFFIIIKTFHITEIFPLSNQTWISFKITIYNARSSEIYLWYTAQNRHLHH